MGNTKLLGGTAGLFPLVFSVAVATGLLLQFDVAGANPAPGAISSTATSDWDLIGSNNPELVHALTCQSRSNSFDVPVAAELRLGTTRRDALHPSLPARGGDIQTLNKAHSACRTQSDNSEDDNESLGESDHAQAVVVKLKTTHGYRWYTLKFNKYSVSIRGRGMDLSLKKRECNTHVIDRFDSEIRDLIGRLMLEYSPDNERKYIPPYLDIWVEINSRVYKFNNRSKGGRFFLAIPDEIIRMKWEEKFNCSQDKESRNRGVGPVAWRAPLPSKWSIVGFPKEED